MRSDGGACDGDRLPSAEQWCATDMEAPDTDGFLYSPRVFMGELPPGQPQSRAPPPRRSPYLVTRCTADLAFRQLVVVQGHQTAIPVCPVA